MKKMIVCLLGALFLSQPIHAHNLADVMEQVLPTVTFIEVENFITHRRVDKETNRLLETKEKTQSTIGTGFVIEGNKVVTNHHMIDKLIKHPETTGNVYVRFFNTPNLRYQATVIGYDEIADIALLQIEGQHPSIKFANNVDDLRMGDNVFTISNFFAIPFSATKGIVSSNYRYDSRFPYVEILQLQIAEGSGSSGGPVFNEKGEVVSINQSVLLMVPDYVFRGRPMRVMSNIAYTIRSDQIQESIERIKGEGVVVRADLGLRLGSYGINTIRYLYDPVANSNGITGVLVTGKDPYASDDFQKDDIIVSIDGEHFTSANNLFNKLGEMEVGDVVKVQVYRNGTLLNITTELKQAHRYD